MLFHSQVFLLVFLPLVLAAHHLAAGRAGQRGWLLVAASLVFYGYWDYRLLPLLAGSVLANWYIAVFHQRRGGRWILGAGIALNLGLLAIFKYADFLADSGAWLMGAHREPWSIVLPLGISFFTFQQISYLADRARGRAPVYRLRDYALYVTFFPQLIAGPIVRHDEIIGQYRLDPQREGVHERLARGGALLLIGLLKKMVFADSLARFVDPVFAAAGRGHVLGAGDAWLATLGFSFQIYFDFSGYSDMAVGLALLFGLALPFNFDAPYRARSVREFWQRWHMTLSRFLRDYLYIPLGGSRRGAWRTAGALVVTMLLGGLWHGAAWTFVAWGALHGLALAVGRGWSATGLRLPTGVAWLLCFAFVTLAWVPFRAPDFASAWSVLTSLAGAHGWSVPLEGVSYRKVWLLAPAFLLAVAGPTSQRVALEWLTPGRGRALIAGVALFVLVLLAGGWQGEEFIYFQF